MLTTILVYLNVIQINSVTICHQKKKKEAINLFSNKYYEFYYIHSYSNLSSFLIF